MADATKGGDAHEHPEKLSSEEEDKNEARNQSFSSTAQAAEFERKKANALLANPLRGYTHKELGNMGKAYAFEHALVEPEDFRAFELGAQLAQNPKAWETVEGLTDDEKVVLKREIESKWSQPRLLYLVIVLCSTCAAVQGMGKSSLSTTTVQGKILTSLQTRLSSMELNCSIRFNSELATLTYNATLGCSASPTRHRTYAARSSAVGSPFPSTTGLDVVAPSSSHVASQLTPACGKASRMLGGRCSSHALLSDLGSAPNLLLCLYTQLSAHRQR